MIEAARMYLFEEVERCTDNQHDGGGLIIIAASEWHAERMIEKINHDRKDNNQSPLYEITHEQWKTVRVFPLSKAMKPEIIVFPNAGCC